MTGPGRPACSEPSPSGWGGAEPHASRLGVAGKTAVLSCTASPLSDPKEGEVRWRGVRHRVAVNFDRPEGSTLLPPSPPRWGGRVTWLQGVGKSLHPG
jgi:hypothetical protein